MDHKASVKTLNSCLTKLFLPAVLLAALTLNVACGSFEADPSLSSSGNGLVDGSDTPSNPDDIVHGTIPGTGATPAPTPYDPDFEYPDPGPTPGRVVSANLRVMTYNIKAIPCLRDNAISAIGGIFGVNECPLVNDIYTKNNRERITELIARIQELRAIGQEPDVIVLQEAFTAKNDLFNDDDVLSIPSRAGYAHHAWGPESKVSNGISDYWNLINQNRASLKGLLSSGLLVLSKHPIVMQKSIEFGDVCTIDDCHGNKGVLLTRIQPAQLGTYVDIVNTHMQAKVDNVQIRSIQADILISFVKANSTAPIGILGGDLNARVQVNEPGLTKIMSQLSARHSGAECVSSATCTVASGTNTTKLAGDNLDHILFAASSPTSATVRKANIPTWVWRAAQLSDHMPVIVDLNLTRSY